MELITDRLNAVVSCIEDRLMEETDKEEISRIARMPFSDVNRLFLSLTDVTVAEYVRKRRMALAAIDLRYRGTKVLDTALKYGYDSPVSFARAFRDFHGFNPGLAGREDYVPKDFPRLVFSIHAKGVKEMIRKDRITIKGKEYEATYFGEAEMSSWSKTYAKREFWRLEDAWEDFRDLPLTQPVLPYSNYPSIDIQIGQVFMIDYHRKDGGLERKYYVADGSVWEDMPCTVEISVDLMKPLRIDRVKVLGKEYDAEYYGEEDISDLPLSRSREFRRLLGTGRDFASIQKGNDVLPYNNYPPCGIRPGDVFEILYHQKDGRDEKTYYIADGTVWQGMRCTIELNIPEE